MTRILQIFTDFILFFTAKIAKIAEKLVFSFAAAIPANENHQPLRGMVGTSNSRYMAISRSIHSQNSAGSAT